MMTNKNECIACTVSNCAYHAQKENYCTLNKIQVGTQNVPTASPLSTRPEVLYNVN